MNQAKTIAEEWHLLTGGEDISFPGQQLPFSVPAGYFEKFPEKADRRAGASSGSAAGGAAGESGDGLPVGNVYADPGAAYFAGLPAQIRERLPASGRIASMPRRRRWPQWAAAAVLAGAMGYAVQQWHARTAPGLSEQLTSVSSQAIESFLEDHPEMLDEQTLYNNLDENSLSPAAFTGETGALPASGQEDTPAALP
ncbi:hypothetical protein [Compostibacter hankyongensis]|uniref:Uncharacterized protein n=1 Tax=Compostibacter hankyongensis TaxID=1007089 RepID=A0ABP8FF56_9BACT